MAEPSGGNSGGGLSHKLGPLPLWGWMVVAVGGYLLYHYMKNRNKTSTPISSTGSVTGATGARGLSPITITPTGDILTATSGQKIGTTSVGSTSSTTTGLDWLTNAQSFLQGLGYSSTQVDTALQNYLAGKKLAATTYNIVNIAIKGIGHPPVTLGVPQTGGTPVAPSISATTGASAAPPSAPSPTDILAAAPKTIIGKIVAIVRQPTGGADYVTTGGYVYSVGGAQYYGGTAGGAIGGTPGSHIVSATQAPGGGYTLVNTQGQTYTFDPQSNYAPGGNAYQPSYGGA